MTRCQSGQEEHTKNRNGLIYSAPPSPRPRRVVADAGRANGNVGGGFSLVAELKKSCILVTF